MTNLAPMLESYFTDRLLCQRRVSPNTVASYRDAFRLLLAFVQENWCMLHGRRVHPHVLRHSCAMSLLHAGVESSVIALWLQHADIRSTQPYIHADMTIKERAPALVTPANIKPGRYTPTDTVLAYLDSLG